MQHPLWRDVELATDAASSPRQRIAARLIKIEKSILLDTLEGLKQAAGGAELPATEAAVAALNASPIKFS